MIGLMNFGCGDSDSSERIESNGESAALFTAKPVAWGHQIPENRIIKNHAPARTGLGEDLSWVRLVFKNLPDEEEGNEYTLIGGGLEDTGFHGPNATGFVGKGYHFAIPEGDTGDNPHRDSRYKEDFTSKVEEGRLRFDFYFQPTDINEWGERYVPGTEVAITLMKKGTNERVLHADNNEYNWSIGGVGKGGSAEIIINMENHN